MSATASGPVRVAEIVRSGFVEGHHYGTVVALRSDGTVEWAVGDPEAPILPRSCNKPMQAVAMVRAGLDLSPRLLALACASHSGEPMHVAGAEEILAGAGLDAGALQTPEDLPLDDVAKNALLRSGGSASRILMNCSGKHAAMLATCVLNGWDTDTYLSPEHPLQQLILQVHAELTGTPVADVVVTVDGCGAPQLSTSPIGLARAFARIASAVGPDGDSREPDLTAERRVAEAIRAHPEMVSGSTRDERRLIEAVPGAIAKAGAESCYAVALADGRAFALKTDDGAPRVRPVLMAAALRRSGVTSMPGVDADAVNATGDLPLLGGGVPVGEIRALF